MPDTVYHQGCLLAMAAGDALGCAVEEKTLEQIHTDYGPDGLMGYDLPGDFAEISAHTQMAAMAGCGLLAALSRGRMESSQRFLSQALTQWGAMRQTKKIPQQTLCWISHYPQMLRTACHSVRVPANLADGRPGSLSMPVNYSREAGALMVPVAVGLFYEKRRMEASDVGVLATHGVALTHGAPEAMLAGAALSYIIAGILQEPDVCLQDQFAQAAASICTQFEKTWPQASDVASAITGAMAMAARDASPQQVMEGLACETALQCLAGAVYACLASEDSFDRAMVIAVNHSGSSSAVGAVTGAIMGAHLGVDAIAPFYLEPLESGDILRQLARDLALGTASSGVFDADWEQKYALGRPVEG